MKRLSIAALLLAMLGFVSSAHAVVVPLTLDNNGIVITDPNQIVDVEYDSNGASGWLVSVGDGLNFEEFFFNYSVPVGLTDISIDTGSWTLVTAGGGGGSAGNFGQFSVKLDGPVSGGSSLLEFEITAAGLFEPNSKGNTFAAKISSQQGGNAGGFVSDGGTAPVSQVPLPSAVWMFLSGLAMFFAFSARTRRSGSTHQSMGAVANASP